MIVNNVLNSFIRIGPVTSAFIGSVLLSIFAIHGSINPNNDGMLYIEAAKLFQDHGVIAAQQVFDWIFFPVLIGVLSKVTGLELEASAYLISVLLIAGLCSLVVACSRIQFRETGWAACFIVLALPALNNYRDYIIREFGSWFFIFLALWFFLRWVDRPSWRLALAAQIAIITAALFRLESLALLLAPVLWQISQLQRPRRATRLLMVSALLICAFFIVLFLWVFGVVTLPERVLFQLSAISPGNLFNSFSKTATVLADEGLNKYAADEAQSILFFGMMSILPVKFVSNLGFFVVPLAYGMYARRGADMFRQWSLSGWMSVFYIVVLIAFLFNRMFLTSRYVALLDLLVIPLIAFGLVMMYRAMPRWRWLIVLIISLSMISNVITTSPKKIHYKEAAEWLVKQSVDRQRVYIEDFEISYLAGWGYKKRSTKRLSKDSLLEAIANGKYDLVLVRSKKHDQRTEDWAKKNRLHILKRFYDKKGRGVLVLRAGG